MIIIRYANNDNILDEEVTMSSIYEDYREIKEKHINADLIYVDKFGIEYCIW